MSIPFWKKRILLVGIYINSLSLTSLDKKEYSGEIRVHFIGPLRFTINTVNHRWFLNFVN